MRFPLQVSLAFVVVSGLAAYPVARLGSPELLSAALAGALLSTVNVLVGYLAIEYAFDKSHTTFLKVVLGGMGLRMLAMLGTMMVLILAFHVHAAGLAVSLMGFSMIYLVLEVLYIQNKMVVKGQE